MNAGFARLALALVTALSLSACQNSAKDAPVAVGEPAASAPVSTEATTPAAAASAGSLHLGAPIEANAPTVTLADLAKNPSAWAGKTFTTEGTVSSVCQHMGCWMEIKDDASQAHIKMAGHRFFVPKTSAGHHARVLASLSASNAPTCSDEADCTQKTAAQTAQEAALSKVELVADGVELM